MIQRLLHAALLVSMLLDAAAANPATAAEQNDWPLFRGDSLSTGVAKTTLPKDLELLWEFEVENGAFESTPAIVDGVAYIGDLDGSVYALDLKTGEKLWEHETDSGFLASPAVRDGLLYIGDFDGRFHALDAKTGKPRWGFETGAEIDSSANFYGDYVLVGSQDATLYALDAKTGDVQWKYTIDDQIRCTPTVVDDRAFLAGCDGKLHIIDLKTGDALADVPIDAPTGVTPAVRGDMVYFGTEAGVFFGVNWKQAEKTWTFEDKGRGQPFRSSAAAGEKHVVVGGRSKRVYALDPTTGEELWSFSTRGRVDSSPVIVGDRVFFGSADRRVYGLDLQTGEKVWEFEVGDSITGAPAVADGKLVIASDGGVVYAFGERE